MKKLSLLALCALFFSTVSMAQWPTATAQQQTLPPPPPRLTGIAGLDFWQGVEQVPSFIDLKKQMDKEGAEYIKREYIGYVFTPPTTNNSMGAQVNPNARITVWINQNNPNTGKVTPVPVSCEIMQHPSSWDTQEFRSASRENPLPVRIVMSGRIVIQQPSQMPIFASFPIAAYF